MVTRRTFAASAFALSPMLIVRPARADDDRQAHRLAIQVSASDPALMTLALNNAVNVAHHFGDLGHEITIEFVAYGPGLHMLRADTSPVKERVQSVAQSIPDLTFTACGNTMDGMRKAEGKEIPILPGVNIVPTGVVRLMELQEKGWSYLRP